MKNKPQSNFFDRLVQIIQSEENLSKEESVEKVNEWLNENSRYAVLDFAQKIWVEEQEIWKTLKNIPSMEFLHGMLKGLQKAREILEGENND